MSKKVLDIGDSFTKIVVEELSRTQIVQYAGASGDYNPLHTDEMFATTIGGHRSVMAHGMLVLGLGSKVLADWLPPDSLTNLDVRFSGPVWPDDTLWIRATVTAADEKDRKRYVTVSFTITNQESVAVVSGEARARWAIVQDVLRHSDQVAT